MKRFIGILLNVISNREESVAFHYIPPKVELTSTRKTIIRLWPQTPSALLAISLFIPKSMLRALNTFVQRMVRRDALTSCVHSQHEPWLGVICQEKNRIRKIYGFRKSMELENQVQYLHLRCFLFSRGFFLFLEQVQTVFI